METKNPVKRVREERDISQQEMAILADVSINTVRNAEKGLTSKLNEQILEAIEQLGYEREEIQEEYETWRVKLKEDIVKRKGKDASDN